MKLFDQNGFTYKHNVVAPVTKIVKIGSFMTSHTMENRQVPCVVIDTTEREDINLLFQNHEHIRNGHVKSTWGINKQNKNEVYLSLEFTEPQKTLIFLKMNLYEYGIAITKMMDNQVIYLQTNQISNRVAPFLGDAITVEIPSNHIKGSWESHYQNQLEKWFKKRGYSKKEARVKAINYIEENRKDLFD